MRGVDLPSSLVPIDCPSCSHLSPISHCFEKEELTIYLQISFKDRCKGEQRIHIFLFPQNVVC